MPSAAAVSRSLVGLVVFLVAGTSVNAQDAPDTTEAIADNAHCDSLPQYGWRTDTIVASVRIEPEDALPAGWDEILLDGISEYLRLPDEVAVPVHGGVPEATGPAAVSLVIRGEVYADLDRSGSLGIPRLSVSSLSPQIDESLLKAAQALGAAGVLPPFPKKVKAKSVRVRFGIDEFPDSGKVSKPLRVVRQPTWLLEREVFPMRGNPAPRFPSNAEAARVGGDVLISFVVGKDGKPIFETARVVKAHYREFQVAVLEVLPRMRFYPARIAGCPIAELVQMPFGFRIGF